MEYSHEKLDSFPRKLTNDRDDSRFGKTWTQVQAILSREVIQLGARNGSVVIRTAHQPWDLRNDGKLRSDARKPEHPGVVIKFDIWNKSTGRYEPLQFECDKFGDWKDNVRAIADALEALRKIERYGVSSSGKENAHYQGYKALPDAKSEKAEAAEFIATHSGCTVNEVLMNSSMFNQAYRKAASKLHPDSPNGSHELFIKLQNAKDCLETL
jgi:hypothetical protein